VSAIPAVGATEFTTMKNVYLVVPAATGLLNNATDAKNRALRVTTVQSPTASGGVVVLTNSSGSFEYQPPPGFSGLDSVTVTVSNGVGSIPAQATVKVLGEWMD